MSKVLIVEDSKMLCGIFNDLLNKYTDFDFDIAQTYEEAKELVMRGRYQFAVADMNLPDARSGEIIPLLNKHNIAPIVFTGIFDEKFREGFESSNIVDYVLKERYDNIIYVIEKLKQLELNKTKTILIVDDSTLYTSFLKQNLQLHNFKVLTAPNGKEALDTLKSHPETELIITDYHMPIMDGLEFVRRVRKKHNKKEVRIITLTSDTNSYTTSRFLKEGANDYITKPFSRDEFYSRIYQNIEAVAMFEDMQHNFDDDIINLLSDITEFRSTETGSHVKRISEYSYILAKLSGMFEDEARLIGKLSTLHDIGKVTIRDTILCKPGKLDTEEYQIMKTHTSYGAKLLERAFTSDVKVGKIAIEIALNHHEKWDGSGYPIGLKGESIPIHARIVAIVDVFDALMNKRVYKEEWSTEKTIQFIQNNAGIHFDPKLTKLFIKHLDCFLNILHKYGTDKDEPKFCKVS